MDLSGPFRGDLARERGLVTRAGLVGPRYRRVYPNVYLPAGSPLTLVNRSRAAYLLVAEYGALAGYSAAELLGARCAPADADAEVIVPLRNFRELPGLRVHRDRLADQELTDLDGVLLTTPARTAYDLARWLALTDAVPAVDALRWSTDVSLDAILAVDRRYPGARWRSRLRGVLELSDAGAQSAMESRCRLALVLRGLPKPRTQFPVIVPGLDRPLHLDLAYPDRRVGIEYDGAGHRSREALRLDNERHNLLLAARWTVLRVTSDDVLRTPDAMALNVRRALAAAA
jgi:very-short-patch-repair endonuclease